MKTKFLYIAALALLVSFTACENETPFDTQTPDDDPIILKPYNESGTGSFTYNLANPDTPLSDSVTVTPSKYTTVNWYLDGQLMYTGTKIYMTFQTGQYDLIIEAVTGKGKRTERFGTVTVHPYDTDPYAPAPSYGRYMAPGMTTTIEGQNLNLVSEVIIAPDIRGREATCTLTPKSATATTLTFDLPEIEEGTYYLRLKDAEGKVYGSDQVQVTRQAMVATGYESFLMSQEWVIIGCNLQNAASVKVGETVVTDLVATASTITLTAPTVEAGEHTLSITNKDGSPVLFLTNDGLVEEVTTEAKDPGALEVTLWEGYCELNWGDSNVRLTKDELAPAAGKTIYVYFELPEAEYHNLRITSDWWGQNLVDQFDVTEGTPNPFTFVYDDRCQGIVADEGGAALIVGFGETITKVTYK